MQWLNNLGTFIEFDWLVHLVECPDISTSKRDLQKGYFCVSSLGMYINLSAIVFSLLRVLLSRTQFSCN